MLRAEAESSQPPLAGNEVTTDLGQGSQVKNLKLARSLTTMAQPHFINEETETPEEMAIIELEPRTFSSKPHCTQGPSSPLLFP